MAAERYNWQMAVLFGIAIGLMVFQLIASVRARAMGEGAAYSVSASEGDR